MKKLTAAAILVVCVTAMVTLISAQQRAQPPQGQPSTLFGGANKADMATMVRPIEMRDTVWMGELTELEVRDLIKAGKTTALVLSGGVEGNGPYLILDKHNIICKAMGESVARKLGNALVAPIIPIEPGDPEKSTTPGAPVFGNETYKMIFTDIATSLRTQGFKNIVFLGDSGGNLRPMQEVQQALNAKWKGAGATIHFIEKYGNSGADSGCCGWGTVSKYKEDVLGVKEEMGKDGYHDDYYISSMVMAQSIDNVRIPQRIKAKKTTINGIELVPTAKAIENGKKLIDFRANQVVKEVQRLMAAAKPSGI